MKKIFLTIVLIVGISQIAKAQISVGGGIAYFDYPGIEAKADIPITSNISISPSVDYLFLKEEDFMNLSLTKFLVNVDGHYKFNISDGFVAYPLVGLGFHYLSKHDDYDSEIEDHFTGFGLNIGGGATYALSDSMKLYAEAKHQQTGLGMSFGILFSL